MKNRVGKFDLGLFIEQNKIIIGSILLVLIIISSGYLLWRENYWKPNLEKRLDEVKLEVESLNQKLALLEEEKVSAMNQAPVVASVPAPTEAPAAPAKNLATAITSAPIGKININTATEAQFDSLSGIGPVLAKRIVDYRSANGPFSSVEGIKKVQGIGDKTFEKFRENITI